MCPTIKDQNILAKLSTGDLIVQEAKDYGLCLVSLHNRARQTKISDEYQDNQGTALSELVACVEDA